MTAQKGVFVALTGASGSICGVRIVPAMPAFCHQPETIDDLVNFVVGKVLDQLGVFNDLFKRWGDR